MRWWIIKNILINIKSRALDDISHYVYENTVVMGPGKKFLTRVGTGQFLWLGSGWARSAIYGMGLGLEYFP